MKAVFIHDHNFVYKEDKNLYYDGSGGAFDENLWKRYLAIFDSLTVVGRKIDSLPNNLVLSSTENVNFELISGLHGFKNIMQNKKSIQVKLTAIIEKSDFVIIRLPSRLGAWAFEICKKLNKKYVLEVVGDPFEAYWFHGNWIGKIIAPIEMIRLKNIVKNAKDVIYVTTEMLQKRYPCHNSSIGISNVRLEKTVENNEVDVFYLKKREAFKIGLIGSFHVKYKGHFEAIRALKYLKDKGHANIELQLVGTGDHSWVEQSIKENNLANEIKIIGAVKSGEDGIFPFLDKTDLYIHPSKQEGLPRVILEAMSRGKMCLGSNVGGTNELLDQKFIHSPGDWRKLAQQIEDLINTTQEDKVTIALDNLKKAQEYIEIILQKRRVEFIKKI